MYEINTNPTAPVVTELSDPPSPLTLTPATLVQQLSSAKGWEQRYRALLGLQQQIQPTAAHTEQSRYAVAGCEAPVWLHISHYQGQYYFASHSSSRLVAGLLVVMLAPLQGASAKQLQTSTLANELSTWLHECGLERQLTPSRSNGLHHILAQAQQWVLAHSRS